ncbi:MAG: GDSL-type esterase/lipase family protein [Pseudomonadota bacterium]
MAFTGCLAEEPTSEATTPSAEKQKPTTALPGARHSTSPIARRAGNTNPRAQARPGIPTARPRIAQHAERPAGARAAPTPRLATFASAATIDDLRQTGTPAKPSIAHETIIPPRPQLARRPRRLVEPPRVVARPSSRPRSQPRVTAAVPTSAAPGLATFFAHLNDLKQGRRNTVTILHLGDSHIASDMLPRAIRARLQKRFGDAGRGMLQPSAPFRWHRADHITFSASGPWKTQSSLTGGPGLYGLTGVIKRATSPDARLSLTTSRYAFDEATVTLLTGPSYGQAVLRVGDVERTVNAYAPRPGSRTFTITQRGRTLSVRPDGDGPIAVASWSILNTRPGIRYVNLGIVGASAWTTSKWQRRQMRRDLARLDPSLIIIGYGTNDAFKPTLQARRYARHVKGLLKTLKRGAPAASMLMILPPGAARKGDGKRSGITCGGLDPAWGLLAKLPTVRRVLARQARQHGAAVWDQATTMGGLCGIATWVKATPPLAKGDHVHLSKAGYARASTALYRHLMALYDSRRQLISRNSAR